MVLKRRINIWGFLFPVLLHKLPDELVLVELLLECLEPVLGDTSFFIFISESFKCAVPSSKLSKHWTGILSVQSGLSLYWYRSCLETFQYHMSHIRGFLCMLLQLSVLAKCLYCWMCAVVCVRTDPGVSLIALQTEPYNYSTSQLL